VVCKSDAAANAIRRLVDEIELYRPLHLSGVTEDEERGDRLSLATRMHPCL
jgi:hypothetical protein